MLSFHETTPTLIYTGHNITLTITLTFTRYLDTNVTIATEWRKNGRELEINTTTEMSTSSMGISPSSIGMSLIRMTSFKALTPNIYQGTLELYNVNNTSIGVYECRVIGIVDNSSNDVLFDDSTSLVDSITLNVIGE